MTEEKKPVRKAAVRKTAVPKKEETNVEAVEVAPIEKAKVRLSKDTLIPVMNNTTGRYGYIGRSGYSFELEEYGDIADVPFGELQEMRSSSQKRHIEDAFIIILDESAVAELNYTKVYENVLDESGILALFNDTTRLEEVLNKMPIVMRETVVSMAKRNYKNRTLFDIRVIETIEKCLNVKIIE